MYSAQFTFKYNFKKLMHNFVIERTEENDGNQFPLF